MKPAAAVAASVLLLAGVWVRAVEAAPTFNDIRVDEHVGAMLPLDAPLVDAAGRRLLLRDLLAHDGPTVLVLAYYSCPVLCDLVITGVAAAAPAFSFTGAGVLVVSFDPSDTAADARTKRGLVGAAALSSGAGWRFAVDADGSARRIADVIGFRYRKDDRTGQFVHPAVIIVIDPAGRVAHYVYGTRFDAAELRSALAAARSGRSTPTLTRIALVCAQFASALGLHAAFINTFLRISGALTFVGVAAGIVWLTKRQRRSDSA